MSDARLYLATPALSDVAAFLSQLKGAFAKGGVASLLVRLGTSDEKAAKRILGEIARAAQDEGVAVVFDGAARLALEAGADGAHVRGCGEELTHAIELLSPSHIVGAGALPTRHDAMVAGEAGADYLLFGDDGDAADFAALQERVRWWSQLFTTPCVALARRDAEIAALIGAGADFLMLGDYVWRDPHGPAAAVAKAQRIVAETSNA
ncbi:MAG TPA: thiamine phosphate synthase [Methylocystis sp.]|nr:thiamine phosphate synthase [Methylocystis sp.]